MRRFRVIPILLLQNRRLVKTIRFSSPKYVGDPINALRIFNEKEVDEICLLDITTDSAGKPDIAFVKELSGECFMPLSYGGGLSSIGQIETLLSCGVEKVILGKAALLQPELLMQAAKIFGSQSIAVAMDITKTFWGTDKVAFNRARQTVDGDVVSWARRFEECGAGEILLQRVERDGSQDGYDLKLINKVCQAVSIPVVAASGASGLDDFCDAINSGASAVAAGSLFVFNGPHRAVLINYPTQDKLSEKCYSKV